MISNPNMTFDLTSSSVDHDKRSLLSHDADLPETLSGNLLSPHSSAEIPATYLPGHYHFLHHHQRLSYIFCHFPMRRSTEIRRKSCEQALCFAKGLRRTCL